MIATMMALALASAEPPALRPGLEPLGFLVGHCWRGEFENGRVDTHCFDAVYGGQHVRDRHEVTGGASAYRGETLYSVDGGAVAFTYWNSQGGVSRGTMRAEPDRLSFGDETYRSSEGRETRISTYWRRAGEDAYQAVTASAGMPSMNRTVTYRRVAAPVSIAETRALDGTTTLIHETIVDAPLEQVWRAIATAEGWREWAVPIAWQQGEDELETSYDPAARPGGPQTIRHRVLARVPGRMIAFRTVKAPEGFPHFDLFGRTTGLFELEPVGESRTRVLVIGAGYPDSEAGRQLLGFFRDGNRITLERLQRRFTEGPIDWSRER